MTSERPVTRQLSLVARHCFRLLQSFYQDQILEGCPIGIDIGFPVRRDLDTPWSPDFNTDKPYRIGHNLFHQRPTPGEIHAINGRIDISAFAYIKSAAIGAPLDW